MMADIGCWTWDVEQSTRETFKTWDIRRGKLEERQGIEDMRRTTLDVRSGCGT